MTCVAAIVTKNAIYMGADSAEVSGSDLTTRADTKVFINGEFLIGFTSSFRMGQLLRYSFKPPRIPSEPEELYRYMVTDFVDAARECFKKGGYAQNDKGDESGGNFLVGVHGRLFQIECDYQVSESLEPYNAAGCGRAYALGALYSTKEVSVREMQPEVRLYQALKAAETFNSAVRSPFKVLILPK